jgi:hypothetical protein
MELFPKLFDGYTSLFFFFNNFGLTRDDGKESFTYLAQSIIDLY